ncbi:MAG: UvrD-helicase domain-containing protein, partial [Firmicutes bacterium]|nr:UvrD-helicase domain-containing protein [Bacillota bacterium]
MNIIDDHANRNAIRTQIKENMFVEAGAGAGKTTLVVERIINQLKEGASPEKFVVITFTNKATEELYSRIVQKLREEVGKAQKGSDEEKCLKKALEVIDLMTISTIHSFCYKLLIEKAFLTDLRLDARLVEAEELEQIQADFLDGQIKNIPPKKRQELYQVFKPSTLKNNLKKGFCDAGENPDNIVYLYDAKGKETEYSAKMAAELMRECCNDALPIIYKELNAAIMEYVKKPVVVSSAAELKDSNYSNYTIKEFYTYAEAAEASSSKLHEVFSAFCTMINTGRILNKISAFKAGDLKKGIGKKKEDIQAELEEKIWSEFEKRGFGEKIKFIRACLYNEMISIILDAVNEYRKYKKEQGNFITNNDLLVKAKKLVCENEEARKFFANRYSYYYVDEFQDTDDIQVDMIYTLAESNPDSTLFVVGDPKQSIYRFRGADISVYKHVKKLMAEHCLELSKNHRSHPRVIKWVNEY